MQEKYTFICHTGCSTCKKARAWLDKNDIAYDVRDIRQENPTAEELAHIAQRSGRAPRAMFNTSGQKYRELGVKGRLAQMPEEEQFALLATDGMLVKRPLLVGGEVALVGFREEQWADALKDGEDGLK